MYKMLIHTTATSRTWVEKPTIEECSAVWQRVRDKTNVGGSDVYKHSGNVKCEGKTVGTISYNGRFWPKEMAA